MFNEDSPSLYFHLLTDLSLTFENGRPLRECVADGERPDHYA
jgi:hypothetical protein